MTDRIRQLESDWTERANSAGMTQRAVLFKRLPGWMNGYIHRQHVQFILKNWPTDASSVLDIGCGYGRIADAIRERHPRTRFQGVDLCPAFAREYEHKYGQCHTGPVQSFEPHDRYDVILFVTVLMYLDPSEQIAALKRIADALQPDGVAICIEPAVEIQETFRSLTGRNDASPTGGFIHYFRKSELRSLLHTSGLSSTMARQIRLVPGVRRTALHHLIAAKRP
jgi:trans-aconitate methyltransferase